MKTSDRTKPPRRPPTAPTTPPRAFRAKTSNKHPDDLDRATDGLLVEFNLVAFEGHSDDGGLG